MQHTHCSRSAAEIHTNFMCNATGKLRNRPESFVVNASSPPSCCSKTTIHMIRLLFQLYLPNCHCTHYFNNRNLSDQGGAAGRPVCCNGNRWNLETSVLAGACLKRTPPSSYLGGWDNVFELKFCAKIKYIFSIRRHRKLNA
jgi:hypothetical protein